MVKAEGHAVQPYEYYLKPGFVLAHTEPTVVRLVLGNAVAVTMWDRGGGFGGISQFVHPRTDDRATASTQYGNVAIPALANLLRRMGAETRHLEAQILGGARCPRLHDRDLGGENVRLARRILGRLEIPVVSEDVGGWMPRKVIYHTGTNEIITLKLDALEGRDWYLPHHDLRFA
jgi:chemotaxis protein CheD